MKKTILFLIISSIFLSCNNSEKNKDLLAKENELLKRELEIEKKENNVSVKKDKQEKFDAESNVEINLIYCENYKFIIKIDRLNNESLRYITWNKPKKNDEKPNLILSNGFVEKEGSMGGYTYTFENGEWTYIIEDKQMGETEESMGIFLKLLQNGNEILYTKMKDLNN